MNRERCIRNGPPWQRGRGGRGRFFRRIAVVAFTVTLLGIYGLLALLWTASVKLGLLDPSTQVAMPALLGAALLTALILAQFIRFGRRFGFPLGAVMEAADRVAGGDYTVRVGVSGPPPVRALAHAFNTMTERLELNDQQRRNLMADVAHELRTPLTVIQGRVEGLLDGVYARDDASLEQVLEETRVLSRLIEDLRTLALSEAGALTLEKEATNLTELARDIADAFAGQAAAQNVSIVIEEGPDATIEIDPVRIREVISNLVSNALRHTAPGGVVTLGVTRRDANRLSVTVADTGAGMTPEEAAQVFQRFYKGTESRGSGLGLAIAQGLVAAHGGTIDITSAPGRGTTITFTLPESQP
jgi:two-component system OmpR family sensor kinase/two-component system sensor histidine kinase BaeS